MSIHALHDDHGRTVRYLRLSLTDRCNLRCLYCHSNARHQCIPHEKVLRYEEMIRLVQIVRGMGVGKVRLTGGEPFARKGCDDFLLRLRQRFDDLDIRITTNGTLLEEHIPLLQRIRISAVNLSLDSFDRETFARVTGRDMLPEVLRGADNFRMLLYSIVLIVMMLLNASPKFASFKAKLRWENLSALFGRKKAVKQK